MGKIGEAGVKKWGDQSIQFLYRLSKNGLFLFFLSNVPVTAPSYVLGMYSYHFQNVDRYSLLSYFYCLCLPIIGL